MAFFVFCQDGEAPLSRALREIKQLLVCEQSLFLYYIKQIDSMLPCICPVIDHSGRQNVVRTSVTHSAIASCATFLFLPHFDVICVLLPDRCTAIWNLFVKYITQIFRIAGTVAIMKNAMNIIDIHLNQVVLGCSQSARP